VCERRWAHEGTEWALVGEPLTHAGDAEAAVVQSEHGATDRVRVISLLPHCSPLSPLNASTRCRR